MPRRTSTASASRRGHPAASALNWSGWSETSATPPLPSPPRAFSPLAPPPPRPASPPARPRRSRPALVGGPRRGPGAGGRVGHLPPAPGPALGRAVHAPGGRGRARAGPEAPPAGQRRPPPRVGDLLPGRRAHAGAPGRLAVLDGTGRADIPRLAARRR